MADDNKQDPLERQLSDLIADQAKYHALAEEDRKTKGKVLDEHVTALAAIQKQVDAIDAKLAQKITAQSEEKGLHDVLKDNESVQRLMRDKSGRAIINLEGRQVFEALEGKATVTSAAIGTVTPGVMPGERMTGIVGEARRVLRVRDVLFSSPTSQPLIYFIKVNAPMVNASPQVETVAKFENAVTFTVDSEEVRTLATWIPAAKQIMDDFAELEAYIRATLPYYVNRLEEQQLLTGDGTVQNLNGLVTQATAFNTALVAGTWQRFDIIGRAIQQVTVADELPPSFIVLHPADWWSIRLTKDGDGRYIFGDPQSPLTNPNIFGLSVVSTTAMAAGTFLVGSGDAAASQIRDRMAMQVEISTEHSDYWTRNMVAIRAEKRLALVVLRPASYIKGTFTTSPA
jgi:HK97 family phage major capsid protein